MIDQVHLEHRFFRRHELDGETLGAYDLELILFRFRREGGDLIHIHTALKRVLPQAFFQARLVFAQLALHGSHGGVDGSEHIGGALGHADNGAAGTDGQFHIVPVLFHTEDHGGLCIRLKITV